MKNKNIYIIGFMATGKTVVGTELARKLGAEFIDMDTAIEEQEKKPVTAIFDQHGESYFRQREKELVKKLATKSRCVVSCGGGVIIDAENRELLKQSGIVVCLTADVETIMARAKNTAGDRPLLNVDDPRARIQELLAQRKPFYDSADVCIDTSHLSIDEAVGAILEFVNKQS